MSPVIARSSAVSVAAAALDLARRVQQGSRGEAQSEFQRIALPIEPLDLLSWVHAQPAGVKTYWRDRAQDFEIAGIHAADFRRSKMSDSSSLLPALNQKDSIRYFGCIRFDANFAYEAASEAPTDRSCFVVPIVSIERQHEDYQLVCTFRPDESSRYYAFSILMNLRAAASIEPGSAIVLAESDSTDRSQWMSSIGRALDAIRAGSIQKLVLARSRTLKLAEPIEPFSLLHQLGEYSKRCFLFGIQFERGSAFIGSSPERLYRRTGRHIDTEAVAGTRPRDDNPAADDLLARQLLESVKDLREHAYVASHIESRLGSLCEQVDASAELNVVKLPRVQHLVRKYHGELRPSVADLGIIGALHPTPAVGGTPVDRAAEMIRALEPFDREWYAGPVGWFGPEGAEFAVGIRSARIFEDEITLYGGAGIVEGSDPETEWNEVEQKLSPFLRIFKRS